MIINLSPVFSNNTLSVSVSGDSIEVNGQAFDFSQLPRGFRLPASAVGSEWFVGDVERSMRGVVTVTLVFPHPENASENMRFPEPINQTLGVVSLPQNTTPQPEPLSVTEQLEEPENGGLESA